MLIFVKLSSEETVALTDRSDIFRYLAEKMPVIGIETKDRGQEDWPDRAMIFLLSEEETALLAGMAALRETAGEQETDGQHEILADLIITEEALLEKAPFLDARYLMRALDRFYKRPAVIAETKRLIIRELAEQDAEELKEMEKDPLIRKYIGSSDTQTEELREAIAAYAVMVEMTGFGIWGLVKKDDNRLIGCAGLMPDPEEGLMIGYALAESARGCGYALEACRKILQIAGEDFGVPAEKIRCRIAPDNLSSMKLAKKLGLTITFEKSPA